jgi:hypothetical protein
MASGPHEVGPAAAGGPSRLGIAVPEEGSGSGAGGVVALATHTKVATPRLPEEGDTEAGPAEGVPPMATANIPVAGAGHSTRPPLPKGAVSCPAAELRGDATCAPFAVVARSTSSVMMPSRQAHHCYSAPPLFCSDVLRRFYKVLFSSAVHREAACVWRRYSEFAALRRRLLRERHLQHIDLLRALDFPPRTRSKRKLSGKDPAVVEARRVALGRWLQCVVALLPQWDDCLRGFLGVGMAEMDAGEHADEDTFGTLTGISIGGLLYCAENTRELFGQEVTEEMSTSELCKTIIQCATVPDGWVCQPELVTTDQHGNDVSANGWYTHTYVNAAGESHRRPPTGTRSVCRLLAADEATRHFVGSPTHFFSHAYVYCCEL